MRELKVGDSAPNLVLETINGERAALADYWENSEILLIIFLRHLG